MSTTSSFEHLAAIRHGARRLLERSRVHAGDLNHLVETAEGVARQAATLAVALARAERNTDGLSRLCSDQARLSADNAEATVRACVDAREQHVEAYRLYSTIDSGPRVGILSKPSPPDVVLAAVQNAVSP